MDDLTSRNFQAVKQAINELNSKLQEERTERMALQTQVAMQNQQIQNLTQQVAILRVARLGSGPTGS